MSLCLKSAYAQESHIQMDAVQRIVNSSIGFPEWHDEIMSRIEYHNLKVFTELGGFLLNKNTTVTIPTQFGEITESGDDFVNGDLFVYFHGFYLATTYFLAGELYPNTYTGTGTMKYGSLDNVKNMRSELVLAYHHHFKDQWKFSLGMRRSSYLDIDTSTQLIQTIGGYQRLTGPKFSLYYNAEHDQYMSQIFRYAIFFDASTPRGYRISTLYNVKEMLLGYLGTMIPVPKLKNTYAGITYENFRTHIAIPIEKKIPLIGQSNSITENGAELVAKSAIRAYDTESGFGLDYISADLKGALNISRESFLKNVAGIQNVSAELSASLTGNWGELFPGIGVRGALQFRNWEFSYGVSKNLYSTFLTMPYKDGAVTYFRINWWQK